MKLSRVVSWDINGGDLAEAQKAIKKLPEGVLKGQQLKVGKNSENSYFLKPLGRLYYLEFPEGLSNITFYRNDGTGEIKYNGQVTFQHGKNKFIIPPLRE